uniref:Sperm acrosome membrane-associated protein 3 n=1 Tax=Aquila chrysaetos chrysaetos TaxID=223781 RepID=A0A663DNA7_AQUCH
GAGLGYLTVLYCLLMPSKAFSRRELAHVLQEEGLDGYGGYSLASWLCVAFNESTFNSAAQSIEADGGADYSIFRSAASCGAPMTAAPQIDNHCRMACRDTTALNITGDIICAKRIVRNLQGMNAW